MKKFLFVCGLFWPVIASAQFTPGQLLTAQELNNQFALYAPLAGATYSGPVTVPSLTVTGTFSLPPQAANTVLGNSTGSSASPSAISVSNCSGSSSALNYTGGSGFGCNATINAATLGGATFASPGSIGSTTAGTGAFTTLSASGTVSGTGFSSLLSSPTAIGNTAPSSGAFTSLSSTGTAALSTVTTSHTILNPGDTTSETTPGSGNIGEPQTATASTVAISSGSATNVVSKSIPAGHWACNGGTYTNPAGTTTQSFNVVSLSTTSATFPQSAPAEVVLAGSVAAGISIGQNVGPVLYNFTAATTVYVVAQVNYATSTLTINGSLTCLRIF